MNFYAFLYALGRMSYIVRDCVDYLVAHWAELHTDTQVRIQAEIKRAAERQC